MSGDGGKPRAMVPVGRGAATVMLALGDGPGSGSRSHRLVALEHAASRSRPGLWGDHPDVPSCLVWLREGDDAIEAFAAGEPGLAIPWLAGRAEGRSIRLAAPEGWEAAARLEAGEVGRGAVASLVRPSPLAAMAGPPVEVARLGPDDRRAFEDAAPPWALRAWGSYFELLTRGSAFGVRSGSGFASLAWVFESGRRFDKVGVATVPRFQRLGLGRAAARALVMDVERTRRKRPLWTTAPDNAESLTLARALGFAGEVAEPLILWEPEASGRDSGTS